jgi:hypothetical protein
VPAARQTREVFPLICLVCGGQMRVIAFRAFSTDIHKILEYVGVEPEAPRISPTRGWRQRR